MLNLGTLTKYSVLILFIMLSGFTRSFAQELPSCSARPTTPLLPRANGFYWCLEIAVDIEGGSELSFTAMDFASDGLLYATRPLTGELLVIRDSDGDGLVDAPAIVTAGLWRPNGIDAQGDALYIIGDGVIYRWQEDELTTLRDDLPAGRGFLPHAIHVHEGRIYAGIPAPCDYCVPDDDLHGTVISMNLQGDDLRVEARGLRYPAALTVVDDVLWVTDIARDGLQAQAADEINLVDLEAADVPHFGWPYCYADQIPDTLAADFDCQTSIPPFLRLPTHSAPFALDWYNLEKFPQVNGEMLLALSGSPDSTTIRGYSVAALDITREDGRIQYETLLPFDGSITGAVRDSPDVFFYDAERGITNETLMRSRIINRRGAGTWPHHIYDLAISPEGWIYVSSGSGFFGRTGSGTIYALRTGDYNPCNFTECD